MRLLALVLLVGCADTPTQTLVRFEADPELEERADAIRVRLFNDEDGQFYDEAPSLTFRLADRKVPVSPKDDDATRRFRVLAELLEEGVPFATVRAETGFVEGEIREVWLRFESSCLPITCGTRESCRRGGCGGDCLDPQPRGSERPTEAYTCTDVDAGFDGGVDVPIDVGPECDCECADDTCTFDGCVPSVPLTELSLGRAHACAIDSMGRLWCWGSNASGEVGVGVPEEGEPPPIDVPMRVADDEFAGVPVTHVSLGDSATGARLGDGRVFTWGDDDFRKLGQGACCGSDRGRFDIPNRLDDDDESALWNNVAYGADHACAIVSGAERFECWGRNTFAQCAQDPVDVMMQFSGPRGNGHFTDWVALSGGTSHTCGIRSLDGGALFCWGDHRNGRLGVVDLTDYRVAPIRVTSGGHTWVSVSAGHAHSCGINDMGELFCWGAYDVGQLGVGGAGDRQQPNQVGSDSPLADGWTHIDTGYEHTCGVHEGSIWCWGSNLGGALGAPAIATTTNVPVQVTGVGYERVRAGDDFTCAIDALGALHCWGRDDSGRLGLARSGDRETPTRVCFSE